MWSIHNGVLENGDTANDLGNEEVDAIGPQRAVRHQRRGRGGAVEPRTRSEGLMTTRWAGRSGSARRSATRRTAARPIDRRGGRTAVKGGLNKPATSSS